MTTENENLAQTSHDTAPAIEVGTLLKRKREELGYSQKQVADRLRLRLTVIEQIDSNQLATDQVATFTRGYLRSYARLVGVDEAVVLAALDDAGDAQHQEQEMQSFSRKTKTEKHNSRIMLITWGVFIIIIGISSLWWWQNQRDNSLSQSVNDTSAVEVPAVVEESENIPALDDVVMQELTVAPEEVDPSVVEEPFPDATPDVELVEEPAAVEAEVAESVQTSPTLASDQQMITMTFEADCWIQVKDAQGNTLISGIRKAGQDLELSGEAPFKVILGAPEGVAMTFASEPVDLSRYTAGKVARFTLPL
ncbi:helix-turn-helix domain-containing protein [Vibrio navarrensis]|uniref:RodZ domain-containing protein n=1 Tax=Vibrio navarrensis TaxID=29495 RepID=UPI00186A049D|nr:RodZ domain-containing protein [Vibrio navarrensis]MBE4594105.1 helix-turn-helix domain-containing protein [Vibrio navarrensis]